MNLIARGRTWAVLAALLAAGALIAWLLPTEPWVWRRDAPAEAWRWWTGAFVHWSGLHLAANLAGATLVGALGWAARLPVRAALAWALAWPLTQLGLWWAQAPDRYGGLSGALHAGVMVASVFLLVLGPRDQRLLGIALALGLAAKIVTEAPWQDAVQWSEGWGFPVAVGAHASGALAGLACALLVLLLSWAMRDWPRR